MKRPQFGLRLIAVAIVATALVFANLDGYQTEPFDNANFFGEPPLINWTHGWPFICLVRQSPIVGSGKTGWIGVTSRWPIDNARIIAFRAKPLLADIAFFIAVMAGTAYGVPLLIDWLKTWRSFSLKTFIGAMTLLSVLFALSVPFFKSERFAHFAIQCFGNDVPLDAKVRHAMQLFAIGIIVVATVTAAFALSHVIYTKAAALFELRRKVMSSSRDETESP
jgi:hypothetical protein